MPSLLPFLLSLLLLLIMYNCDPLTCPATATAAIIINYSSCDSAPAVVQESQSTVLSCPLYSLLSPPIDRVDCTFSLLFLSLFCTLSISQRQFFPCRPICIHSRSFCLFDKSALIAKALTTQVLVMSEGQPWFNCFLSPFNVYPQPCAVKLSNNCVVYEKKSVLIESF